MTQAGGLSRLCATEWDKMARDWFKDQVLALGADYSVSMARREIVLVWLMLMFG